MDQKETAASPVKQPAAAPIDPTDPGYDVETLREHIRHLERRVRQLSALSPADERAAQHDDLIWRLLLVGRHPDFAICMEAAKALREARAAASPAAAIPKRGDDEDA
ncbi:hypothetical protein [Burkholderia multivorans]|uniref:hypothetical protein n=1 Tax=Burkholderia multivorans TaxID=87883 RepID=UPI0007537624|nr:hypothetical protein [Burkholderia multivorans]KWH17622.1 hypothetical protein WL98_26975 [Burkholderia multivorans]